MLDRAPGIFIGAEGGGAVWLLIVDGAAGGAGFPEFWYCVATLCRRDKAIGIADDAIGV